MSEYLGQQLLRWGAYRSELEKEQVQALKEADNAIFPWVVVGSLVGATAGAWSLKVGNGYVFALLGAVIVAVVHVVFLDRWKKNRIKSDYALRLKEADRQIVAHMGRIEKLRDRLA